MNNLKREKIQRFLFEQEQLKLLEDKKKYPASFGLINDINDFLSAISIFL